MASQRGNSLLGKLDIQFPFHLVVPFTDPHLSDNASDLQLIFFPQLDDLNFLVFLWKRKTRH
ncbi:MAG: hypothetical protein ACFFDT_12445 [Candidatus Hodarchaeota archaeon]